MNNKLPARGEILFITALRSNEKMASLLSDLSGSNESSSGREIKSYALTKRTFSIILALFRLRTLEPEEPYFIAAKAQPVPGPAGPAHSSLCPSLKRLPGEVSTPRIHCPGQPCPGYS
jgi:hypothetical protein